VVSSERKATLAPRLLQTLIRQEIDPVTEIGTTASRFLVNELKVLTKLGIRSRRQLFGTTWAPPLPAYF
jgi:hypothetical protein